MVLHAGLDLSRKRVDVCLLSDAGELLGQFPAPVDRDGLYGLTRRVAVYGEPVRGVVESMNGARFVHDELTRYGWEVMLADAQKVKGLAPLACKTDKVDARVLAELSLRDLVPAIWLPPAELRRDRERSRYRLYLVKHRTSLKNRIHATLITFGYQRSMADLFGAEGRRLLERLDIPEPWLATMRVSLQLIDDLDKRIGQIEGAAALRRRSPIRAAAPDSARDRLGIGLYDRRGDRRHQPVRIGQKAGQLHRPVPARQAIRRERSPRTNLKTRAPLSALGADRGRPARQRPPALRRALPAHQTPARQTTRPQGRQDRSRPPARRGDLVHADPQPTLRSGRRRNPSGCLTAPA